MPPERRDERRTPCRACTVSAPAEEYGGHPTMRHPWSEPFCAIGSRPVASALLEGAADIGERGAKNKAEVDDESVRSLRAKIGTRAVGNDLSSSKLGPWAGRSGAG